MDPCGLHLQADTEASGVIELRLGLYRADRNPYTNLTERLQSSYMKPSERHKPQPEDVSSGDADKAPGSTLLDFLQV